MPAVRGAEKSNAVRRYVRERYIDPARQRGETSVRVVVGEVHRALGLERRVPLVCSALRSEIFLKENGILLKQTEGPPSGQSTTVVYTYGLSANEAPPAVKVHPFWSLRGVARKMYQEYGGGEAFLEAERNGFIGIEEKSKDKGPIEK